MLDGVAALLAPGATGRVLLSVTPRDGVPPLPEPDELAAAYARRGLTLVEARPSTAEEVAASGSSWAKRLRAGTNRPVTLLRLRAAPLALPRVEQRVDVVPLRRAEVESIQ